MSERRVLRRRDVLASGALVGATVFAGCVGGDGDDVDGYPGGSRETVCPIARYCASGSTCLTVRSCSPRMDT